MLKIEENTVPALEQLLEKYANEPTSEAQPVFLLHSHQSFPLHFSTTKKDKRLITMTTIQTPGMPSPLLTVNIVNSIQAHWNPETSFCSCLTVSNSVEHLWYLVNEFEVWSIDIWAHLNRFLVQLNWSNECAEYFFKTSVTWTSLANSSFTRAKLFC